MLSWCEKYNVKNQYGSPQESTTLKFEGIKHWAFSMIKRYVWFYCGIINERGNVTINQTYLYFSFHFSMKSLNLVWKQNCLKKKTFYTNKNLCLGVLFYLRWESCYQTSFKLKCSFSIIDIGLQLRIHIE